MGASRELDGIVNRTCAYPIKKKVSSRELAAHPVK